MKQSAPVGIAVLPSLDGDVHQPGTQAVASSSSSLLPCYSSDPSSGKDLIEAVSATQVNPPAINSSTQVQDGEQRPLVEYQTKIPSKTTSASARPSTPGTTSHPPASSIKIAIEGLVSCKFSLYQTSGGAQEQTLKYALSSFGQVYAKSLVLNEPHYIPSGQRSLSNDPPAVPPLNTPPPAVSPLAVSPPAVSPPTVSPPTVSPPPSLLPPSLPPPSLPPPSLPPPPFLPPSNPKPGWFLYLRLPLPTNRVRSRTAGLQTTQNKESMQPPSITAHPNRSR
ncbi:hypothetical protein BN14_03730 [Rhizoctonia solani AG-1 IB]|uniref:Uncharacterized protein n=1 Tax=Thanatephorus cucumeris (strain AG1-IB / isolate 7/3/14) TaxID=1108050 RepID=M5C1K4_THACB|nr:hypothetical protein BN14_03730 [Rhizoctonia solani AG-1 IB]